MRLKISNLKVDCAGNGQERLFIFVQWKVYENSWHAERFKVISVRHNHVFLKSHQRNKTNRTPHKEELADKIFSKMGVLCKWEQVTLYCYGHYIMSLTKTVLFFFCFSLKLKTSFFLSAWLLFYFLGAQTWVL